MRLIGSKWSWAPVAALAAAFPLLAVQAQSTPPAAAPAAVPPAVSADLPDGPGKAQIMADCAACHAPTIVASERHTADEWSAIIAVMVDRGAQVSDADNAAITAYLAKNYGKAAGAPTG